MKRSVVVSVLLLMLFTSCSKDPVSSLGTPSVAHRMLFSPDTLRGPVYQYYAIKARVDGISEADVYLNWDLDGASGLAAPTHWPAGKPITNVTYTAPGRYKIVARAYDNFNDTLVRADSTLAIIDTAQRTVDLLPNSCDTGLTMNSNGAIAQPINFIVKTGSLSDFFSFVFHATGPGIDTTIHQFSNELNLAFPSLGTYRIRVTALDAGGKTYGSDSSTIRIVPPHVDLTLLRKMSRVSVFYSLDSGTGSFFFASAGFIAVGLPDTSFAATGISWIGNRFTLHLQFDTLPDFASYEIMGHDSISGLVSADAQSVVSVFSSVSDTINENALPPDYDNWSGTAANLKLLAVTDSQVIYSVTALSFGNLVPDFSINRTALFDSHASGNPDSDFLASIELGEMLPPPRAYVVFTK